MSKAFHLPTLPKNALIAFGKMLELGRKERGWRQSDLSERIGISRQTLARMEEGDPNVAIGYYFTAGWLLDLPIFPGVEPKTSSLNQLLIQFLDLLKNKYPQRITKLEKKIENDF